MTNRCIIIPAYNEEKNVGAVIRNIQAMTDADIIIIDDGSADATADEAKRAGAYVISLPFNMGYSVALQTGYKFADKNNYEVLLQMDGDGQHPAESVPLFFDMIENGRCDIVIGSRFLCANCYRIGLAKRMAIALFRFIIRVVNGSEISDPTSGFQCMGRKVFTIFTHDHFLSDYPDTNMIIRLHRLGFQIEEIPVKMAENPDGRSMHKGLFKIIYYFFTMFLSIFIALISDNGNSGGKER